MSKLRKCIDCQKDISDRHNRCIRCKECQKKADIISTSERSRRKYVKKHPKTTNRTARKKITIGKVRNPGTGNLNGQGFNCGVNKNGEYPTKRKWWMHYSKMYHKDSKEWTYEDKESRARNDVLVGKDEILVWNWSESKKDEYEHITAKYAHRSARPNPGEDDYKYYTDLKDKDYIEHWEEYLKRKANNDKIQHKESQRVLRQRKKANKGKKLWTDNELKILKKQKEKEKKRVKNWKPKKEVKKNEDKNNPETIDYIIEENNEQDEW